VSRFLPGGQVLGIPLGVSRRFLGRVCFFQLPKFVRRQILRRGVVAQLQGADVRGDGPTIGGRDLRGKVRHGAKAVRDDVE